MVHCCCVPSYPHWSDREHHLSYFEQWVHRIGRKNLLINSYTLVCSSHFDQVARRQLRPDEVPSLNLPVLTSVAKCTPRRPPKERAFQEPFRSVHFRSVHLRSVHFRRPPKERAFQGMSTRVDSEAENSCTSTRNAFTQVENVSTNAAGELALMAAKQGFLMLCTVLRAMQSGTKVSVCYRRSGRLSGVVVKRGSTVSLLKN